MRRFAALLVLLVVAPVAIIAPVAAQPLPTEVDAPGPASFAGQTHLYGELFGATFSGLSVNVEQPVVGPLAVRGGGGFMLGLSSNDVHATLVGGLVAVPGSGAYRPEFAATATVVVGDEGHAFYGPYLGVRYHAENGSVIRLGVHALLLREEGRWSGGPWPAVSFGSRL